MNSFFEKHKGLGFEDLENPPFDSPELCALTKIYNLGHGLWIGAGINDELNILSYDYTAWDLTEEDIIYLCKCGVEWNNTNGIMFINLY